MRQPFTPRPLRFALILAASVAAVALGTAVGCGPDPGTFWLCLNPETGKEDAQVYDSMHFVNGVADPCHCFDPCGPLKSCPIVVDAGELAPGCDAGTSGDGG